VLLELRLGPFDELPRSLIDNAKGFSSGMGSPELFTRIRHFQTRV